MFEADKFMENWDESYHKVKLALQKTQERQKKATDKHYRDLKFTKMIGSCCLLPKVG